MYQALYRPLNRGDNKQNSHWITKRRPRPLNRGSPLIRWPLKVARYSFSGSIPPKFEHKLRRHKQKLWKIATTVLLDKDENLLWSGLQRHRSCHSNEMTLLAILLAAVFLGTENCSSKIVHGSFFLKWRPRCSWNLSEICKSVISRFIGIKFL